MNWQRIQGVHPIRRSPARTALVMSLLLGLSGTTLAQVNFSEVVTFGDSGTDNQPLGGFNPLYGADPIEAVFMKGAGDGARLSNYAVFGCESKDLIWQVIWYYLSVLGKNQEPATLISIQIGGNVFARHFSQLAVYGPGEDAATDAVVDELIMNLARAINWLYIWHPNARFVVWTLGDPTCSPRMCSLAGTQYQANLQAHCRRVNEFILWLNIWHSVVIVDTERILSEWVVNGISVCGQPLAMPPAFGALDHLFADSGHPTAVGNALLANEIIHVLNNEFGASSPVYQEQELASLAGMTSGICP